MCEGRKTLLVDADGSEGSSEDPGESEAEGEGSVGQVGEQVDVRTAAPYGQHLQTSRSRSTSAHLGSCDGSASAHSPCAPCCWN